MYVHCTPSRGDMCILVPYHDIPCLPANVCLYVWTHSCTYASVTNMLSSTQTYAPAYTRTYHLFEQKLRVAVMRYQLGWHTLALKCNKSNYACMPACLPVHSRHPYICPHTHSYMPAYTLTCNPHMHPHAPYSHKHMPANTHKSIYAYILIVHAKAHRRTHTHTEILSTRHASTLNS
jgi:hypothetical protein